MDSWKSKLRAAKQDNLFQDVIGSIEKHTSLNDDFDQEIRDHPCERTQAETETCSFEKEDEPVARTAKTLIEDLSKQVLLSWRNERDFLASRLQRTNELKAQEKAAREKKAKFEVKKRQLLAKKREIEQASYLNSIQSDLDKQFKTFTTAEKDMVSANLAKTQRHFMHRRPMRFVPLIDMSDTKLKLEKEVEEIIGRLRGEREIQKTCNHLSKLLRETQDA